MKEKYLPIGTVLLLKDATKMLMITGYCSSTPEDPNKVYDYVACLFPEGGLAGDEVALFNHDQIGTITHMGLDNDEFKVYYQPKVETDTYHLIGAEALVRWYRKGKLISPCEFIPIIEQNGSICNLDFYVLEQVWL